VTETIATLIVGGDDAAWPVAGKSMVVARMVAATTDVTRAFMVNSFTDV
jgi:hypothetical protein